MTSDQITVVLVDDNHVVRMGLAMVLEGADDVTVVAEAASGQECIDAVDKLSPDVVLLDVRMPGSFDGVATAARIADRTGVLMMTYSDDHAVVKGALDAGARGYLVHGDAGPDDILAGIRSVASGRTYLNGRAGDVMVEMVSGAPVATARPVHDDTGLTTREREIMDLVAQGLSNPAIAKQLFISPSTLKNHITRIFDKLAVSGRSEAIVLWLGGVRSQD